ncbi:MAG: GDP-L-fucose synthase family protein [Candidatus Adiutrix sp.]
MHKDAKIYIAGHKGLVGSAIVRALAALGYHNLITRPSDQLDLRTQSAVWDFFQQEKPEYVFLAAAKVGGILANNTYPAEFLHHNILIQNNVIDSAYQNGCQKLLFLGSSCIYPKLCPQPIKEEYLLSGPLEPTNESYAVAKISGLKMCESYRRQYGFNAISAMPTNMYGLGDNYHPENSHVIPGLIRRFHEAKVAQADSVVIWGTGTPRREFLYSSDLAAGLIFLMEHYNEAQHINIGAGCDLSIMELAKLIAKTVGFEGQVKTDPTKPDGTPQKLMDTSRLNALGWQPQTTLKAGLKLAYADFQKHYMPQATKK